MPRTNTPAPPQQSDALLTRPGRQQLDHGHVDKQVARDLFTSPYSELRRVQCSQHNGAVVLSGRVTSYFLKQAAQEIARRVDQALVIINQLEVEGEANRSPAPGRYIDAAG